MLLHQEMLHTHYEWLSCSGLYVQVAAYLQNCNRIACILLTWWRRGKAAIFADCFNLYVDCIVRE